MHWHLAHGSGEHHMQRDLELLHQTLQDGCPRWRCYRWDQTTLSLGRHQDCPASLGIPWVRRPTGGRAVLHGAGLDLTYALTWRPPSTWSRRRVYAYLCQVVQRTAATWGIPLELGGNQPYQRHASCFASHTHADLVWQGEKVSGSAQLWQQGVVLQHGTLLLAPDHQLWEQYLPGSRVRGLYEIAALLGGPMPSLEDLCRALHQHSQALLTDTSIVSLHAGENFNKS
ncbi:MAG: hypothetical protein Q6K70_06230 [Thermostichales cyanobacterium DRC_bins_46]